LAKLQRLFLITEHKDGQNRLSKVSVTRTAPPADLAFAALANAFILSDWFTLRLPPKDWKDE